ncbi:MAG: ABC transporter ATP-binding protein [Geminicoccaceae bacterium]
MSSSVAISCQGISKSFALVDGGNAWRLLLPKQTGLQVYQALSDVSFDVPKGQFVGILGRNGAGKSTLLRVTGGVYTADRGKVVMDGLLSGLYELGLACSPELTGRRYAERLLMVHGFPAAEREALIADIHDFSELDDRFDDPIVTYSAGMGARLFFSTATAGDYDVYLLDEILSVGDPHFQAKCWRRLRERVSNGASGVLVTHDWAAIIKLCETAHVLERGRIIYSGPAEKAARYYLYGEKSKSEFCPGVAHFSARPSYPQTLEPGEDLVIRAAARIERSADVGVVFVIERLQPGYGWETALMSRTSEPVGHDPGVYEVEITIPKLPLEPGGYQISLQLTMPSPEDPRQRRVLDGFSWLDGNGLPLEIEGAPDHGLTLPSHWTVRAA